VRGGCILFLQRFSPRVLGAANGILELAFELVRLAVSLKFGIACRVADEFIADPTVILVDVYVLLIVITRDKTEKLALRAPRPLT
jgi:hypothetical protein